MVSLHFTPLAFEAMYKHLLHALNVSPMFADRSPFDVATLIGKTELAFTTCGYEHGSGSFLLELHT